MTLFKQLSTQFLPEVDLAGLVSAALPPVLSTEGIGCESISEQLFGLG